MFSVCRLLQVRFGSAPDALLFEFRNDIVLRAGPRAGAGRVQAYAQSLAGSCYSGVNQDRARKCLRWLAEI
jgi:hypothetical protein